MHLECDCKFQQLGLKCYLDVHRSNDINSTKIIFFELIESYVPSLFPSYMWHIYEIREMWFSPSGRLTKYEFLLQTGWKGISYITSKQDGWVNEVSCCPGSFLQLKCYCYPDAINLLISLLHTDDILSLISRLVSMKEMNQFSSIQSSKA